MSRLLYVELLKIRRSLAVWIMVAIPLLVVALNAVIVVKRYQLDAITPEQWSIYWNNVAALWCYFMLPLYIALITGLLNGLEHKNQTWRLMLTLPVSQLELFLVKGFLAWLLAVGATLFLLAGAGLAVGLIGICGGSMTGATSFESIPMLGKVMLACLPVLVVQHVLSWRFSNLVLPLAVGVIATMSITQVGASRYWTWHPWTYSIMATMGKDLAMQQEALVLAGVVGAILLLVSAAWLGRREVDS